MRRLIVFTLLALCACTPREEAAWLGWHALDPSAALEYLYDEGIADRPDEGWTDVTSSGDEWGDNADGWGQCSEWMDDALAAGWTSAQWETLNWVMAAESGCDPDATSSAGAQGLLQMMPMWADDCGGGSLYDPWFNLSCGLHVYHQQGWSAWDVWD